MSNETSPPSSTPSAAPAPESEVILPTLNFGAFQPVGVAWDRDAPQGPFFPGMLVNSLGDMSQPPEALVLVAWPLFQTPPCVVELAQDPMQAERAGTNDNGSEDFAALAERQRGLKQQRDQWCAEAVKEAIQKGALLIPFYFAEPQPGRERFMFSAGGSNTMEATFASMRNAGSDPMVRVMLDGDDPASTDIAALIYGEVYLAGAFEVAGLTSMFGLANQWADWLEQQHASLEG